MEKQQADLDHKIRTLNFTVKKKDEILPKDDRLALERHKIMLESMVTALTTLKESIEEKKFTKGENEEKIQEKAADVETAVDEADTVPLQTMGPFAAILPQSNHRFDLQFHHGKTASNHIKNLSFT